MQQFKYSKVLTIAGSDSGGGAGIQADIKTISALGCYGSTAITAITVQNTIGVKSIHDVPIEIVRDQILAVMDDIKPDAIKIGMIHTPELASMIYSTLKKYSEIPIILDPVMVATSGDKLIKDETIELLKTKLFHLANLVTPNLDEAEILTKFKIQTTTDMIDAAIAILETGCGAVLIKGGHLRGNKLFDVYFDKNNHHIFESERIETNNVHGTGCSLSSAIASFIALGHQLPGAIQNARNYIHSAIENGKDVKTGEGNGPLNHFFNPQKLIKNELV